MMKPDEEKIIEQLAPAIKEYQELSYDKPLAVLKQKNRTSVIIFKMLKWAVAAGFVLFFLTAVLILVNLLNLKKQPRINLQSLTSPKQSVTMSFSMPSMTINESEFMKRFSKLKSKSITIPSEPKS